MKRLAWLGMVLLLLVLAAWAGSARAAGGAGLQLERSQLVSGGGPLTGGGYRLHTSLGQTFASEASGGGFTLYAGLLIPDGKVIYLPVITQ